MARRNGICGNVVTLDELANAPVAPGSETYRPLAHIVVRNVLVNAIENQGLSIVRERNVLSPGAKRMREGSSRSNDPTTYTGPGARAFGLLELKGVSDDADYNSALVWRNGQDKIIQLGAATGGSCFICDNLLIRGDEYHFRKHTSRIDVEAEARIIVEKLLKSMEGFRDFVRSLKEARCPTHYFDVLVADCIRAKVLTGIEAYEMLQAFAGICPKDAPEGFAQRLKDGVYSEGNAWAAHGLFTELIVKKIDATNPMMMEKQQVFNKIIESRLL